MAARNCPSCGRLVAASLEHCPHCGYRVGAMQATAPQFRGPNPHNSIFWIVMAVLFFWPFAIPSAIYYSKSDNAWNVGNEDLARHYGDKGKRWGKAPLAICLILFGILILAFALGA